jgi:tRNA modification GTPase
MDTIVALSSGRPPAAIAVVRISGPAAKAVAATLAGSLPPARQAAVRTLRQAGAPLDRALVLVFDRPASATGEDLVEFHCHGGRAVVDAVEAAVLTRPDVRRALPGEFTRRALIHGRIDLAEAEGLADLLAAETETQRRAAWQGAGGAIGRQVRDWMMRLSELAADIEVRIDYDDEGDTPTVAPDIGTPLRALSDEMRNVVAAPPIERVRDGISVVIAGPPNAGKSTLINALAERDVAIISPVSGTTRDRLEAPVQREGVAYLLTDTAGLTDTVDPVEAQGIALSREALERADIVLWLSADAPPPHPHLLTVHAKADLPERSRPPAGALAIAAVTGRGVTELWNAIACEARALLPQDDALVITRRQRDLLASVDHELSQAGEAIDWLLLAEHVRAARHLLATLLGVNATETMLDTLFSRFCLGK